MKRFLAFVFLFSASITEISSQPKIDFSGYAEDLPGVGITGASAGEMISEGVLAVEMAAKAADLTLTIHPHPTLSETVMEAAEVFFGQSTHLYRPKKK